MLEGQSLLRWTTRESAHLKGTPVTFWPGSSPVAALLYSVLFGCQPNFLPGSLFFSLFMTINTNPGRESLEEQICCLNSLREQGAYIQNGLGPFKITIMFIHV